MITTCFENSLKEVLGKEAISYCRGFVLKVHEQPISADSDFEDKKPNLCFAEISKLKLRTDGVVKPRPNDRNMSTQHIATLLDASCCVRLATLLRCVATCCVLLAQV